MFFYYALKYLNKQNVCSIIIKKGGFYNENGSS